MKAVGMQVRLVGVTAVTSEFWDVIEETGLSAREHLEQPFSDDAALLVEAAGRKCYESMDLPREATRTNAKYMANIKRQLHFSILEHANYTFYVEGVSRANLAEITRHRHHSFSVRSQRFVDESDSNYILPKVMVDNKDDPKVARALGLLKRIHEEARLAYVEIQDALEHTGVTSRKVRNDAARYVLPEGTETKFYVTANGRGWLELLEKRTSPGAADEIRELAKAIHADLAHHSPTIFEEN